MPPRNQKIKNVVHPLAETDEYSLDPFEMLSQAGVQRGRGNDLIHYVSKREGIRVKDGKRYYEVIDYERKVAPPGMSMDDAREHNLDVFNAELGWIWGGNKRAKDSPENLGHGLDSRTNMRLVPVEDDVVDSPELYGVEV